VPIEIRRFGVGYRRPEGPPGTTGLTGQVVHSDARGLVSELAFSRGARIEPHSNPNTTYFIVIEGGGWVSVSDERTRVAAGEAVVWPANVDHSAWTDHSPMRVLVVEFAGEDDAAARGVLPGVARELGPGEAGTAGRGEGTLAPREIDPERVDRSSGEPL
jgi:quercetin dioxygenase-like cupin family protein